MQTCGNELLSVSDLTVKVPGRTLIDSLTMRINAGERLAVLGQNGSGKSLLLAALCGLNQPSRGVIELKGKDLSKLSRRDVARQIAVLEQDPADGFPESVLGSVLCGRHPHIGRWQRESEIDRQLALASLSAVGLDAFSERWTDSLSGGEQQRVALARVLTQQPSLYVLDEPTNHLDLKHQIRILRHVSDLAREGAAILMSLHDVNLAAKFADRVLLLDGRGGFKLGAVADVLTESNLTELLGLPMRRMSVGRDQFFHVAAVE